MAEYTTHYNLKKPAKNENYNIDVANENNDIIDEKLYGKVDKKVDKDLSTNDFTNEYKKKLDNLKNYDDSEVIKQITSFNERAGKVEEANTEISKNIEALKMDNETNETAISELKETTAQNANNITSIQEEQTAQNTSIEKNTTDIAQNKKDVDEELTKIKKENSLLKSQIPEGHASGNDIHLEDSSNMPFEWRLNGGSRQEMREGYNLANLDADSFIKNGVTVTNNGDGSWTFNGKSSTAGDLVLTKNVLLSNKIYQFEDAKYLFKTIVVSGSFSNPDKVTVRTMGMGQDDGVDNFLILNNELRDGEFSKIFNKKSTSHLSRLELYCGPNVTFNNYTIKILFAKTDNKELEWEQYGVSPSLEFLSEVENLEGKNKYYIPNTGKVKSHGITATYTKNTSEVILDGVATASFSDGFEIKDILLKKGTYSLSVWGLNGFDTEYDRFFIFNTENGKVLVNYVQGYRTQKFILEQDTNVKLAYIIKDGSTYSNAKIKIMINEGDIGLSYIPYNSLKIRKTGKNILSDNRDDYNGSIYGYIKLLNNFGNNNLVLSIEDNDKSIDMTGIFLGVTGNGKNWDNLGIWLLNDGKKVENSISTNKYPFFSFYPNNQTTFDKIFKRYKIQAEISKGIVPTEFEKYKSNSWIFPLEPGQKLYEGSYLAEDGIHNRRKQIVLTGNGNWYMITNISTTKTQAFCLNNIVNNISVNHVTFKSNYFVHKKWIDAIYVHLDEPYMSQTDTTNIYLNIYKSLLPSVDATGFKSWLKSLYDAGKPVKIEYPLAKEEIIPYTQEQQKVIDTALHTYKNITNISVDNELATLDITYKKDIETMFNNQAKEYNERLSNIENLLNTTETSALLLDNLESDLEKEV